VLHYGAIPGHEGDFLTIHAAPGEQHREI